VIDDLVLAGQGVLGGAEGVEGGPHRRRRRDGPRRADGRKDARDALDEVPDLLARGPDLIEIAVKIVVGGADNAHVLPGGHEDLPAVDGPGRDGVVGEAPVVDDVDPFSGADARGARREPPERGRDG
jgi:hypothetical protein